LNPDNWKFADVDGKLFIKIGHHNVLAYGAVGDGNTDDTTACQTAINATLLGSPSAQEVFFPRGTYKTTVALDVPSASALRGEGELSTIRPYNNDGFHLLDSDVIGARRIEDLWLWSSTDASPPSNVGIDCNLDATAGDQVYGLVIRNVYITGFGTAIYAQGLRECLIESVVTNHCWFGITIIDKNTNINIHDCRLSLGTTTGAGNSIGINVGPSGGAYSSYPEGVHIDKTLVFGFDEGITWNNCLYGSINKCDVDGITKTGVTLTTASGGLVVDDNYIMCAHASNDLTGIQFTALGSQPSPKENCRVSNNHITTNLASSGSTKGLHVSTNWTGVVVEENVIDYSGTGTWNTGLQSTDNYKCKILNNQVQGDGATEGTFIMQTCTDPIVAGNDFGGDYVFSGNTRPIIGHNTGNFYSGDTQSVTTTLTASQVNNLRATPITVVPAQGAGTIIEFISAMVLFDYAAVFTVAGDEDFYIRFNGGTTDYLSDIIETTGFLDQTADMTKRVRAASAVTPVASLSANKQLEIVNTGAGETADGTGSSLTVIVTYRVHLTGL